MHSNLVPSSAFDFNALDYLLKPIEPDRLKESVQKLLKRAQKDADEEADEQKKLGPQDRVFVKDGASYSDHSWHIFGHIVLKTAILH